MPKTKVKGLKLQNLLEVRKTNLERRRYRKLLSLRKKTSFSLENSRAGRRRFRHTYPSLSVVAPSETKALSNDGIRKKIFDGKSSSGQRTILVAEDKEAMALLSNKTLSKRGYKVLIARDGEEAINLYQRHKNESDLVLLDIGLPKMAG